MYLGEDLRTLKGRRYQKKRNHVNSFLKDYEGRFEYKALGKEDFKDCLRVVKEWAIEKVDDEYENETLAIKKVFDNYNRLDVSFVECI